VRKTTERLGVVFLLVAGLIMGISAPANAMTRQISGIAFFDTSGRCEFPLTGYPDYISYPPIVMTASLDGCWYTKVESSTLSAGNVYQERGQEVFIGTLNGRPVGTFATTYKFTAKLNPDGSEVRGRCEHPIVAGSGTGGFAGAAGRVDFKDDVENALFIYRGHIGLS
jgi:hypothetical protein